MKNLFGFLSLLGIVGMIIGIMAALINNDSPLPAMVIYVSVSVFLLCGAIWKHLDNQDIMIRLLKGDKEDETINLFSELSRKIKSLLGAGNNYCE